MTWARDWACNPGTQHWPGIEPETLLCASQSSNHLAMQARAGPSISYLGPENDDWWILRQ